MEARRERVGRYRVLAELGRGAMGVVYRAHDPQLDRQVAIKTVRRDLGLTPEEDAELRKRVHQEATAAGRLTHPNIVAIHDVLELDEIPYIVMEYVEGRTLADLIGAGGPPPPSQAVRLVTEVCRGLEYAHAHGVVHRDIKPSNILVTASGTAKVTDFGIARIAGSHVTRTGAILGTPAYMAPEQLRGQALDGRSDIFALGVTLYEALTGAPPFQGDDIVAVLYQIVHEAPVPVSVRNPAVPRALGPVTERAMAKDPAARYATAGAFAEALTRAMSTPVAPGSMATRAVKLGAAERRRRRRAALVAVACLSIVGVGGWAAWARRAPDRPVVAALPAPSATESPGPAQPAPPAAAPRAVEADPPAAPPLAPASPGGVSAEPVKPVEEPAPPIASAPPVEPPPPTPPVTAERTPPRPTQALGSIRVVTDPSVDVLLDGKHRGRTKGTPLVVPKVAPGERMLTLRLASREQTLLTVVNGGQTATVTYHFPPELPPTSVDKAREALEKTQREALAKLREGVEKAQREATSVLRGVFGSGEGDRGPEPERR